MNWNPSFVRKVLYLGAIAILLFPLFLLGQPTTPRFPGGKLARLRTDYNLSEARLGEIDPASESMKLATLGMRGVAANVLWHKANEYKKTEDWDNLSATLNQITKLQPHFISVWENQAHNLSYNVSVEFDDYRQRYHWVKKGIDFLIEGTRYNRQEPRLLWYTGWFFGQKFGRADEHKQFRRMFRVDTDFHSEIQKYVDLDRGARGPDNRPDNWLAGRLWYVEGQRLVDTEGVPIRGKSPLVFHSQTPMSRINHSVAIEEEGFLDEKAELSWRTSGDEWRQFGSRVIPSSWGENLRLNDLETVRASIEEAKKELNEAVPGVEKKLRDERYAALTPAQQKALDTPEQERVGDQYPLAYEAQQKVHVTPFEIVQNAPDDVKAKARRIAQKIESLLLTAERTTRYRDQVNFDYWRMRCEAEQLADTVQARRHMFDGDRLKNDADLESARKEYELAWNLWAKIFKEFPQLIEDRSDDLAAALKNYEDLLGQLDAEMPPDFPLYDVRDAQMRAKGLKPPPRPARAPSDASAKDADSDAPKNEPAAPAEGTPSTEPKPEEKSNTEEKSPTEEKPKAEEKPKVDDQPATEEKAKFEEKPQSDEKPASEDKPDAEKSQVDPPQPADEGAKPEEKPASEKPAEEDKA